MTFEAFLALIHNALVLLALGLLFPRLAGWLFHRSSWRRMVAGAAVGGIGLSVMSLHWTAAPGVVFDTRSVLLSLSGLFFGLAPTLVAAAMMAALRVAMGGAGTVMGISVIIATAAMGLVWRGRSGTSLHRLGWLHLYLFGLAVHLVMILLMGTLPGALMWPTLKAVAVPVLVIYPLGTVLLGRLLVTEREEMELARAVAESERKYRLYIDSAPTGVFVADSGGRYVEVNDAGCRMTGYSREEILGRPVTDFSPPEDKASGSAHFDAVQTSGKSTGVLSFLRKDGSVGWWSVEAVALGDGRFIGFSTDVSELKRLELEAAASERKLNEAQQLARIGSWDCDLATGTVRASPEAFRIYGADEVPLTLGMIKQFPLPEYRPRLDEAMKALIAGEGPYDVEFRIRREGDGSIRDIHSLATYDPVKRIIAGTIQDITRRKQAERAIRESDERFRAVFEHAAVGIGIVGLDGRWIRANERLCSLLGYTAGELQMRSFEATTHPDDLDEDLRLGGECLAGRRSFFTMEKRYIHKQGHEVWVELTVSLIRSAAGEPAYFISVVQDIGTRKRLEQEHDRVEAELRQAQKMDAVGRLAGGVAHDFNNMLNVILGYAEVVLEDIDPEDPHRPSLEGIRSAAERSAQLTGQLLAFSRKQIVAPGVLDLNEAVASQKKLLDRLIGENVEITFVPGEDLWPVRIDPSQLDQILANLAVNARDAIAGVGRVLIRTANLRLEEGTTRQGDPIPAGDFVLLEFGDTGKGIASEHLDKIFEPFFTTKPVEQGTGLGLATVYGVVTQHGGHLDVTSAPDRGTTFRIYLPRYCGVRRKTEPAPAQRPLGGGETILLVEDEPQLLNLAARMLEKGGYTVLKGETPSRALEIAAGFPGDIHLVVSDVIMPQMNGKELVNRVQALRPGLGVLFMSGYTDDAIADQGVLEEGVHFLNKPFTLAEVQAAVRTALDA
ncbi:PAS domain S-box protein [bacterium]|nr:PAS domain S-box protein [bacterium]